MKDEVETQYLNSVRDVFDQFRSYLHQKDIHF